jgi:hypothetical protein
VASESDALRMSAEIVDKFSPTLKSLQRSLRSLSAETGGFHKQAIVQSKSHEEALSRLRREIGGVAERVKTGLAPAMSTLGLGSLSAAAGVAALTKSLADFAGSARHLEFMSKQTQLTVNQLRIWEQEASRLETTAETLTGGFTEFNAQMEKMRRGGPFIGVRREIEQLRSTLGVWRSGELAKLVQSLQGLGREAQLEKILKFLDRIDNISQRRNLLKAFGLDPALANKTSTEILKDLDAIHERLGDLTPEQLKGGTEFQTALENIKTSLTGLRDKVGADLAPALVGVADAIAEFSKLHAGDIADGLRGFVEEMRKLGNSELVSNLRAFASGVDRVVEATTGWAPIIATMALYKFAQFTGIIAGLRGIATALGLLSTVAKPAPWLLALLGVGGSTTLGIAGTGAALGEIARRLSNEGEAEDPNNPDFRDPMTGARLRSPGTPFRGNAGDKDEPGAAPSQPWWRRIFGANESGITPAAYRVEGGGPNPLLGGAGADRGLEGIIERGTLAALRDFAAEQKAGAEGGGGGGGGGVTRANYSPGGGGGGTDAGGDGGGVGGVVVPEGCQAWASFPALRPAFNIRRPSRNSAAAGALAGLRARNV